MISDWSASPGARLSRLDIALIVLLAAALYAPAVFSGRPLSIHEGRLPQLAAEMLWNHGDWLLPTSGGRPWLERPPMPHWFTAASMKLLGRPGSLWPPRLPAALAGLCIGLMSAAMCARWFGRAAGLLAGVMTISSYEIYQYSTLAEDDIYLGLVAVACVAMFVFQQWHIGEGDGESDDELAAARSPSLIKSLVGARPWKTVLFFVLLGATNLVKGPLVGALPVMGTVGVFLIWNRDRRGIIHYAWLWGWLIFIALTLAWPLWAVRHYPDVVNNWMFDYLGRTQGGDPAAAHQWDHPVWYYLVMMPMSLAPWTWATLIGLAATARLAWRTPESPRSANAAVRFVWCWAMMGLIVLSLPARKHHQYLVPIIVPWAIIGMFGVVAATRWLVARYPERADVARRRMDYVVIAFLATFIVAGGIIQFAVAGRDAHTMAELALLRKADTLVPPGQPLLINADIDALEFFRLQYSYLHPQRLLQNLSYLRDPALNQPANYVLTRAMDENYLKTLGDVKLLAAEAPAGSRTENGLGFALFELQPRPDLARYPLPPYVGVLEAMGRLHGPWLGGAANAVHVRPSQMNDGS